MAENTLTIEFKDSDPPKAPGVGSAAVTPTTAPQLQPATANVSGPVGAGIPVTSSPVRSGDVKAVPVRVVPDGASFTPANMSGAWQSPSENDRLEELRNQEQLSPEDIAEFNRILADRVTAFDAMFEAAKPIELPTAKPEQAKPEPQPDQEEITTLEPIPKATPLSELPQAKPASEEAKRERDRKHAQWLRDRDAEDAFDAGEAAKMKAEKEVEQAASMAKMRTAGSAAQSAANGDYLSAGLQAASTGALGEEAAMLAAGPEGALLALAQTLYDAAKDIVSKPFELAREGIDQAGKTGENIANGDLKSVASDYVEAVSGFAEKTGLAGVVVGEFVKTEWAAVNALNQVTDAFLKRARELSQYDGRIAEANAQADVRRLMADIRESDKLGADLARLTKSSSDVEALQTELMLFLKGELLAALLEVVEPIGEIAKSLKPILKEITGISGEVKILAGIAKVTPAVLVLRMINAVIDWFEDPKKKQKRDDEAAGIIGDLIDLARRGMDTGNTEVTIPSQRQEPWPQGPTWGGRRNA